MILLKILAILIIDLRGGPPVEEHLHIKEVPCTQWNKVIGYPRLCQSLHFIKLTYMTCATNRNGIQCILN